MPSVVTEQQVVQDQTVWLKSPKFGLYYPKTFNIREAYTDPSGKDTTETQGVPTFMATFGEGQDTAISWGGYFNNQKAICSLRDFGTFQYGTSNGACVKGYRAVVGHFSARAITTPDDLKIFGDFVLKNNQ